MAHRFLRCVYVQNVPLKKLLHCGCRRFSNHPSGYRKSLFTVTTQQGSDRICGACSFAASKLDRHFSQDGDLRCSYYKYKYLLSPAKCSLLSQISVPSSQQWLILSRSYHRTSIRFKSKDESTVEKTVKALKEDSVHPVSELPTTVAEVKPSLWQRFVAELKHYYHGFRLLFIDFRVSSKLLWSILNGKTLTRREHKQLIRTTADLFRLVPFLVFVIVPFMEFLLPVAVKLFPSMLPSTFKEKDKEQEKLKKQLKVKLEMAKFLQDTIEESALEGGKNKKDGKNRTAEFSHFMQKIRSSGIQTPSDELLKFSKLFEDEITLDNLSRAQLQALCRVLELPTIGMDNFLRFQLRLKLRQLKADDKVIHGGQIEIKYLACLEFHHNLWPSDGTVLYTTHTYEILSWSHIARILLVLLLLHVCLKIIHFQSEEAKIKIAEMTGEKVDNKAKLERIKREQEAIQKEKEEHDVEEELEEKERVKKEREIAEAEAAGAVMDTKEEIRDEAPILDSQAAEELTDIEVVDIEEKITKHDLEDIETALEEIVEQKQLSIEKEELEDLKEDVTEYKEDLEDLKSVILASGGSEHDLSESKGAKRLLKRLDKMIDQLDVITDKLHIQREQIQEEIEVGEVKIRRSPELRADEEKREDFLQELSEKKGTVISINEMVLALKRLQKIPNDSRLQRIVEVLDEDHDGNIEVSHVLKVIELMGQENVMMTPVQVSKAIELIKQETALKEEEKLMEKVKKEEKENMS
ncbi:hypothetical protein ScPMuIL_000459 [Solemya velum]